MSPESSLKIGNFVKDLQKTSKNLISQVFSNRHNYTLIHKVLFLEALASLELGMSLSQSVTQSLSHTWFRQTVSLGGKAGSS